MLTSSDLNRTPGWVRLSLAVVAAVTLASCGGSDSASETTATPTTEAATTTEAVTIAPATTEAATTAPTTTEAPTTAPTTTTTTTPATTVPEEDPADIPGVIMTLGEPVTGIIDAATKPVDVYRLELDATQTLLVSISAPDGYDLLTIYSPGTTSLEGATDEDIATVESGDVEFEFEVAAPGTYYFAITADGAGQSYELKARSLDAEPDAPITDDIPGVPLALNTPVSGILDETTKPVDVYQLELTAGDIMLFTLNAPNDFKELKLYYPGTRTIVTAGSDETAFAECCEYELVHEFAVATSGTYYVAISADGAGQSYELTVSVK